MAEVSQTGSSGYITKYDDTKNKKASTEMGKEDFLKLLVAQLTHQDPTNPMQDTEFVAQLTSYSGLEQQMNMNKNLEKLINIQNGANVSSAVSCIGRLIGYTDDKGQPAAKVCEFLDIVDGDVNLYFKDGTFIPFSKVEQVG